MDTAPSPVPVYRYRALKYPPKLSKGGRTLGSQTPGVPATWHSRPAGQSVKNAAFLRRNRPSSDLEHLDDERSSDANNARTVPAATPDCLNCLDQLQPVVAQRQARHQHIQEMHL